MLHEVVAAMITRSQRILLGLRSVNREYYPGVWDVFGGHVEPGERREQTLLRELREELGILPVQWTYLETITDPPISHPQNPAEQLIMHLYLVTEWTGTPENVQPEEHSAIGWFSLAEAVRLPLLHPSYPKLFERYLSVDLKK